MIKNFMPKTFPCMTKQGCPRRTLEPGQDGFCPVWTDTTMEETNVVTQETRLMRGCMFQLMPRMMEHVIKASNRPAAEIGQLRAEVGQSIVQGIANFLARADQDLIANAIRETHRLQAGNGEDKQSTFRLTVPKE